MCDLNTLRVWARASFFILLQVSIASTAFAREGDIHAGGGGAESGVHFSKEKILKKVREGRLNLRFFLHKAEYQFHQGEKLPSALFFAKNEKGHPLVFLNKVRVEARMSAACRDLSNEEVDGSAKESEGSLCISVQRLSNKLHSDNYEIESFGLLVHEYAHLYGADENQAKAIQEEGRQFWRSMGKEDFPARWKRADQNFTTLWGKLNDYYDGYQSHSVEFLKELLDHSWGYFSDATMLRQPLREGEQFPNYSPELALDLIDTTYLHFYHFYMSLHAYMNRDASKDMNRVPRNVSWYELDKIFEKKTELSPAEYFARMKNYNLTDPVFPELAWKEYSFKMSNERNGWGSWNPEEEMKLYREEEFQKSWVFSKFEDDLRRWIQDEVRQFNFAYRELEEQKDFELEYQ